MIFFSCQERRWFSSCISEKCIWNPIIWPTPVGDNHKSTKINEMKDETLKRWTEYINEWSLVRNVIGLPSYNIKTSEIPLRTVTLLLISNDNYANTQMKVTWEYRTAYKRKPRNGYSLQAQKIILWKFMKEVEWQYFWLVYVLLRPEWVRWFILKICEHTSPKTSEHYRVN